MIYDVNGQPLWNFVLAMPPDDERAFEFDLLCTAGCIFAAYPSSAFANIIVEARPVEVIPASWVNIITDPIDLTSYASIIPKRFELRTTTEADAFGRNMFSLYVGSPLE